MTDTECRSVAKCGLLIKLCHNRRHKWNRHANLLEAFIPMLSVQPSYVTVGVVVKVKYLVGHSSRHATSVVLLLFSETL